MPRSVDSTSTRSTSERYRARQRSRASGNRGDTNLAQHGANVSAHLLDASVTRPDQQVIHDRASNHVLQKLGIGTIRQQAHVARPAHDLAYHPAPGEQVTIPIDRHQLRRGWRRANQPGNDFTVIAPRDGLRERVDQPRGHLRRRDAICRRQPALGRLPRHRHRLREKVLSGRPSTVNSRSRDAGPPGDLIEARALDAVFDKKFQGRAQDGAVGSRVAGPAGAAPCSDFSRPHSGLPPGAGAIRIRRKFLMILTPIGSAARGTRRYRRQARRIDQGKTISA